jgi:hypothetical protein
MNSIRKISRIHTLSNKLNLSKDTYVSQREFISKLFWEECVGLGPWIPFEEVESENPVFFVFGNAFFKWRDLCLSCFSRYPFSNFQISLGELLVHIFLVLGALGFNFLCGYTTFVDTTSKTTGLLSMIFMVLTFSFTGKISIWNLFFGLPHERQLQFHKNCAWGLALSATVHGVYKGYQHWQGVTGMIFGSVLLLLFVFAINCFRR